MDNTVKEALSKIHKLNKFDKEFPATCDTFVRSIKKGDFSFVDLVESLESLLVNADVEKRELGIVILSETLDQFPPDFFSAEHLGIISKFYADRIRDKPQVVPAVLKGFGALVRMKNIPGESGQLILKSLADNVQCQGLQKEERLCIYGIFKELLANRTEDIQKMGLDFVLTVIQAIDGERNCNNLLTLFCWLPTFLKTVKLSHLTEEMFNNLECYYPIDFQDGPQSDIKRDDLANALSECLCAIPEFGQYCIPLIIQKMDSTLQIAKTDSLKLLITSCRTFEVGLYEAHFFNLLNCLQQQLFSFPKDEVESLSLSALTEIVKKISESNEEAFLRDSLGTFYESVRGNLRPDAKLYTTTVKILISISMASKKSCNLITIHVIPLLVNQFKITAAPVQQQMLLKNLVHFVKIYVEKNNICDLMSDNLLVEIPTLCLMAVMRDESIVCISGYQSLIDLVAVMPEDTREGLFELFQYKIFEADHRDRREMFLKCFEVYADAYNEETLDCLSSITSLESDATKLGLYLEVVCRIASKKSFALELVPKMIEYCKNPNISVATTSVDWLRHLVHSSFYVNKLQTFLYEECKLLDVLMELVSTPSWQEKHADIFHLVSLLMREIIAYQPPEEQQKIIDKYLKQIYCKENVGLHPNMLAILGGFLIRIKPEVVLDFRYDLIKELLQWSSCMNFKKYEMASQLVANLINKANEDDNYQKSLTEIKTYILSTLETQPNKEQIINLMNLQAWVTKALLIKGYFYTDDWVNQMIEFLDTYEEAAPCFRIIAEENCEATGLHSNCVNRVLYRQKYVAYIFKTLARDYNENRPNYLTALGFVIQYTSNKIVLLYLKEIFSMLMLILDRSCDEDILLHILKFLFSLMKRKNPFLEHHIEDILTRLLNLTKCQVSMKVRIAALECIEVSIVYPVYKLLQHKNTIIHTLAQCSDDKKRLVRQQAMQTRASWCLLDSPL